MVIIPRKKHAILISGFRNDWLEPEARREFDARARCVGKTLTEYKAEV